MYTQLYKAVASQVGALIKGIKRNVYLVPFTYFRSSGNSPLSNEVVIRGVVRTISQLHEVVPLNWRKVSIVINTRRTKPDRPIVQAICIGVVNVDVTNPSTALRTG